MEGLQELKMYRVNVTMTFLVQAEDIDSAEDAAFEAVNDELGYLYAKQAAYHEPELVEE